MRAGKLENLNDSDIAKADEALDRRRCYRVRIEGAAVDVLRESPPVEGEPWRVSAPVVDISSAGLQFSKERSPGFLRSLFQRPLFAPGEVLFLTVRLPQAKEPFRVAGRVMHAAPAGDRRNERVGVEFLDARAIDSERLRQIGSADKGPAPAGAA